MKKIKFLSLALLATMCSLVMVSCDDDDATVDENDVPNGTEVINYSIQIIPTSLNGKVAGLADVKVTVNQNGTKQTKTTDASGIVAFDKGRDERKTSEEHGRWKNQTSKTSQYVAR